MYTLQKNIRSLFYRHEEPQRVRATSLGTALPPELLPLILRWVSREDHTKEVKETFHLKTKRPKTVEEYYDMYDRAVEIAGARHTLSSCSLVCLYWANRCREYMFDGASLSIGDLEEAETFKKYATDGCPNLVPICTLIRGLRVRMQYRTHSGVQTRSYLDIVYLAQTCTKLESLEIIGPVPRAIPPSRLSSPHWSLVNTRTPPPSVTAYKSVKLSQLALPSYRHFLGYLKHFSAAEKLEFFGITWEQAKAARPEQLVRGVKLAARYRHSVFVSAERCTDNAQVCLQTAMLYPDFPLRSAPQPEQNWVIDIVTFLNGCYREKPNSDSEETEGELRVSECVIRTFSLKDNDEGRYTGFTFTIKSETPGHYIVSVDFIIDLKPHLSHSHPTRLYYGSRKTPSPVPPHVSCLCITLRACKPIPAPGQRQTASTSTSAASPEPNSESHDSQAQRQLHSHIDLAFLRKYIQDHPSIQVLLFLFHDLPTLRALVEQFPSLRQPQSEFEFFDGARGGGMGTGRRCVLLCLGRPGEFPFNQVEAPVWVVERPDWDEVRGRGRGKGRGKGRGGGRGGKGETVEENGGEKGKGEEEGKAEEKGEEAKGEERGTSKDGNGEEHNAEDQPQAEDQSKNQTQNKNKNQGQTEDKLKSKTAPTTTTTEDPEKEKEKKPNIWTRPLRRQAPDLVTTKWYVMDPDSLMPTGEIWAVREPNEIGRSFLRSAGG